MKPIPFRTHPFAFLCALIMMFAAATRAALPHVEQLAPGVFAAGFADRYGSANCGWVTLSDHTLLIDLPYGVGVTEFLAEVESSTRRPPRSLICTRDHERNLDFITALQQRGLTRIPTANAAISLGDTSNPIEFIP